MWPRTARPYSRGSLGPEGPQHAVFVEGRPPSILLLEPIGSAPKQTESTRSQGIQDEYWYRAAPFLSSDNCLKLKTCFCIFFVSFQTMWNSLWRNGCVEDRDGLREGWQMLNRLWGMCTLLNQPRVKLVRFHLTSAVQDSRCYTHTHTHTHARSHTFTQPHAHKQAHTGKEVSAHFLHFYSSCKYAAICGIVGADIYRVWVIETHSPRPFFYLFFNVCTACIAGVGDSFRQY